MGPETVSIPYKYNGSLESPYNTLLIKIMTNYQEVEGQAGDALACDFDFHNTN
jgi:hypothetical protein